MTFGQSVLTFHRILISEVQVSLGEVDYRDPVERMAQELWGHLYGDRGHISKVLHDALLVGGLKLITLIRRNMKPRLMRL